MPEVSEFVIKFRSDIENCWDETTANTGWSGWPPPEHSTASYGQCGPTTLLLHELLTNNFPTEKFSIASGRVRLLGARGLRMAITTHMWVDRKSPKYEEIDVLDVTPDQAKGIVFPSQIIATYDKLEDQGIMYVPRMHYDTAEVYYATYDHAEAKDRTAILREKYYALKDH